MRSSIIIAAALLGATVLLGCPVEEPEAYVALVQQTSPPPLGTASLFDSEDEKLIRLSRGVAMGVGCYEACPVEDDAAPRPMCEVFTVSSGDPDVVGVYNVFRNDGTPSRLLAGLGAGETTVTIRTRCGKTTYQAIVD